MLVSRHFKYRGLAVSVRAAETGGWRGTVTAGPLGEFVGTVAAPSEDDAVRLARDFIDQHLGRGPAPLTEADVAAVLGKAGAGEVPVAEPVYADEKDERNARLVAAAPELLEYVRLLTNAYVNSCASAETDPLVAEAVELYRRVVGREGVRP
jgi:hypothetical protein